MQQPLRLQITPETGRDVEVEHPQIFLQLLGTASARNDAGNTGMMQRELQRGRFQRHATLRTERVDLANLGENVSWCRRVVEPGAWDRAACQNPGVVRATQDDADATLFA